MPSIHLGDYVGGATMGPISTTAYGHLERYELAAFLTAWPGLHREALARVPERIHPTAFVHPLAIVGEDVIIGPDVRIHEFSTVRKGSVLCAGASVGFNCEVTACVVGEGAVLGHRISINRTIVGTEAHLSAGVTVAAIHLCEDMRAPDREVIVRVPDGLYRCGTTQFGALIGDGVQTGSVISLGPGVVIGRSCRISSGVTLASRAVTAQSVVSAPHTADAHVRQRQARSPHR
ncbi:transferase [Streptomyces sp. ISL-100]|uniref:transferase n=1 Tax=Streptomyces sp. ISL-100 TaxID=2819173 RepID=UPI001BEBF887|nr:transferase [Streptomyces sp. ISL-100]MBT2395511.1 transferase [Streptomyces sp. ISL-100]